MPLGAAFLSIFAGNLSDFMGRKTTMLFLIIPMTVGWALLIWANNITMLYLGRFITGSIAGAYCVLSPMYSIEIAQKEIRGALGCFTQLNIAIGVLLATIFGKYLELQIYTVVCGVIPLVFGCTFIFMPETPTYLLKKGNLEGAKKSLSILRGPNYNVDEEIHEIQLSLQEKGNISLKIIKESLKKKATKRSCVIAFGLMIFRVLCGVDAITAYASYIMEFGGLQMDFQLGTIILIVIEVMAAIVQAFLIDRLGRKVLLLASIILITIVLFIVGISISLKERQLVDEEYLPAIGYIPLVALCFFYIGYALGLGPIPWMITGEIFPQEIKSLGISLSNFTSWIMTFGVVKCFLVVKMAWGGDMAFVLLGVMSVIGTVFLYFTVHETKGKSLAQIQHELSL